MVSSFAAIKVLVVVLLALALPVVVVWTVVKSLQGLFWVLGALGKGIKAVFRGLGGAVGFIVRHFGRFVRGMALDTLRFVGAVLTSAVILPLALLNFCFGRWTSAVHYARALEDELSSAGANLYRVAVGHPVRFLGLGLLTEGIERRLPDLVARAPQAPARRWRPGHFEGYKVTGTLPPGGSGALLYLARPLPAKLEQLRATGHPDPGQVVIKAFALGAGSTLPQIVRESRALEAASRLGLVLEHNLAEDAFHYVMPYVPGPRLDEVITDLHRRAGDEGLAQRDLHTVIGYTTDLLQTLARFHGGGLWHKDIKPGNVIVSGHRAQLVDLGLVTPLQSAMTLTTHGTEYFRDPEMVRLALRGVKVHEVDGVKFDIYSVGAVLYAMVENSFPAHGSLSRISKRCPEALKWIVRRAMADMDARYGHAREMLGDLEVLLNSRDPFAVQPAQLPSVRGDVGQPAVNDDPQPFLEPVPLRPLHEGAVAAASPAGLAGPPTEGTRRRRTTRALVGAGAWMLVLGTSLAGFLVLAEDGSHPTHVVLHSPGSARPVADPAPSATRRAGLRALAAEADRWTSEAFGWTEELAPLLGARETAAPAPAPPVAVNTTPVRVLVVEEMATGVDRTELGELCGALDDAGFTVFGGGVGDADPLAVELEAGARKAIGLGHPEDAETEQRLREFLLGSPELEAIVWVTEDPDHRGDARYHMLVRESGRAAELAATAAAQN